MAESELIGVTSASQKTGVPESTLRYWRMVDQGPPSFKIGRRVVYRRQDVDAWIAAQEAVSRRGGGDAA